MPSPIQTLPSEVVHLIAAGEVIDSLASVVRELVENALDANATRIIISIWPDQWRVRVADNGCGMNLEDLRLAATPHSTSKITCCEDLWKINTLGFRGEALHSLAQLSELEIASRLSNPHPTVDKGSGWRILYDALGEPIIEEAVAIAPGTVVTAANLFGNWQIRRQGLPSPTQQLKAVQAIIYQISICHPHVTWQVQQNERQWFTISSGDTPQQILPQILRDIKLTDLQFLKIQLPPELTEENNPLPHSPTPHSPLPTPEYLELVLGLPDRCHRHRADWVRLATNGRIVKSPALEQTIMAAFQRTLPRDRYPICFVHLRIYPAKIDWNRHPAKSEIYLHSMNYWQEKITQAIGQALQINSANLPEAIHTERLGKLLTVAENKTNYNTNSSPPKTVSHQNEFGLLELRAIAQVHNTYIVAEHPAGLWLVEQHIAHERVLYEQLCDTWKLVHLELPIVLNYLSPSQIAQLQRIGLEVEPFGEQMWAIRNVPTLLLNREDCTDALLELSLGGDLQTAQVAIACRSAIRNGTPLTIEQMQHILEQWQRTRHPRTCPHGRPIYLSLEETVLAKFFRRHWVIGKSHGI